MGAGYPAGGEVATSFGVRHLGSELNGTVNADERRNLIRCGYLGKNGADAGCARKISIDTSRIFL